MGESRNWYIFLRGCFRLLFASVYRWKIEGHEHVPTEGSAVICSNHISLWDPLLVGSAVKRDVRFMAKEELFHIPVISFFLKRILAFPVKRGQSDIRAIKTAIQVLRNQEILGIFPEGTRQKAGEPEEAQQGAAMIALKAKAPIIPVAVIGPYRIFQPIRVVFGSPIETAPYATGKVDKKVIGQVTQVMMKEIQLLIDLHR
jgi:1-acyl-sn-glycerol-3-phosphate acyltransferase